MHALISAHTSKHARTRARTCREIVAHTLEHEHMQPNARTHAHIRAKSHARRVHINPQKCMCAHTRVRAHTSTRGYRTRARTRDSWAYHQEQPQKYARTHARTDAPNVTTATNAPSHTIMHACAHPARACTDTRARAHARTPRSVSNARRPPRSAARAHARRAQNPTAARSDGERRGLWRCARWLAPRQP